MVNMYTDYTQQDVCRPLTVSMVAPITDNWGKEDDKPAPATPSRSFRAGPRLHKDILED